jgi:hypothetical protein
MQWFRNGLLLCLVCSVLFADSATTNQPSVQQSQEEDMAPPAVLEALAGDYSIEFEGIHIQRYMAILSEGTDVGFMIDSSVCPTPKIIPETGEKFSPPNCTIRRMLLYSVPLSDIVTAACLQTDLDWAVRKGYVWITTPEKLELERLDSGIGKASAVARELKSNAMIKKNLQALVTIEFDRIHLEELLPIFEGSFGIYLVVDQSVCFPKHQSLNRLVGTTGIAGIQRDCMIDRIAVNNVPLKEALRLICQKTGLAYTIFPRFIWLSTSTRLKEAGLPNAMEPAVTAESSAAEHPPDL